MLHPEAGAPLPHNNELFRSRPFMLITYTQPTIESLSYDVLQYETCAFSEQRQIRSNDKQDLPSQRRLAGRDWTRVFAFVLSARGTSRVLSNNCIRAHASCVEFKSPCRDRGNSARLYRRFLVVVVSLLL